MSIETEYVGNPAASSPDVVTNDPTAVTTADGCPAPLGWAQVLEAVRAQSTPWSVEVEGHHFCGRTLGVGTPLYFLNGLTGTSDLFCLMVWILRDEFRCVVFDYPARTSRRPRSLTNELLASGLFAAADRHADRAFSIIATSFGSMIGLTALAAQPERITSAILQAGFAHRKLSATESLLARIGEHVPGTLASLPFVKAFQQANHQRYFPPFDRTRWGFFVDNAGGTAISDAAERTRVLAAFDYRSRLNGIHQPILLIRSEHEGLVTAACSEALQSGLPHATTEMLHTTGPLAHLTHPHRLVKLVKTFLTDPARPPEGDAVCLHEAH
jgi:2-succinyl-6-hydroxy-2,4-cyclohexadiene-1-carboxylate synthase